MLGIGVFIAFVGALVVAIGFGLEPISAGSTLFERMASMGLANERLTLKLMLVITGNVLFLSGIVLLAVQLVASKLKETQPVVDGERPAQGRRKLAA